MSQPEEKVIQLRKPVKLGSGETEVVYSSLSLREPLRNSRNVISRRRMSISGVLPTMARRLRRRNRGRHPLFYVGAGGRGEIESLAAGLVAKAG
jgi:hypothetical protein